MLPSRLLDCERTADGRIVPRWLLARDEPWLREMVHEAMAADGRSVGEADDRVVETVAPVARHHRSGRKVVEAVWLVERRRWSLRVDAPVAPRVIRRILFELAAERSRDEAIATAAAELGVDHGKLESFLFADRPHAKRLVAPPEPPTTTALALAYNLAVVQSLLARATKVVAIARANLRRVVGYAKLLGLMATFDETPDGSGTLITLSGPMALFHETVKYGHAMARWFPALVATPGWSLTADIVFGGLTQRFELDAGSPVPRTHSLPRAHDSRLEARLESDLRRMQSSWQIEREVAVVRVPPHDGRRGRLLFPDFALVSETGRVLVEIAGYWSEDYLKDKLAMMNAARVPIIMCIDERHVGPELTLDGRFVPFRKTVDVPSLLRACERALSAARALRPSDSGLLHPA